MLIRDAAYQQQPKRQQQHVDNEEIVRPQKPGSGTNAQAAQQAAQNACADKDRKQSFGLASIADFGGIPGEGDSVGKLENSGTSFILWRIVSAACPT